MTPQEELAALRHLIEKQQKEIAEKDTVIEKQNDQIEKQGAQLEKQRIQIENMIQALLQAHKKMFGASTEATKQVEGQLFLFEEAQKLAEQLGVEQKRSRLSPIPGHHANQVSGYRACRPANRSRRIYHSGRGDPQQMRRGTQSDRKADRQNRSGV